MHPGVETVDRMEPIAPLGTETARRLVGLTESMLQWRQSQARLEPQEEAVRRFILTQYPLLGRAPSCLEIAGALGLDRPDQVRAILERLHERDLLYLDPDSREIRLTYPFSTVPTKHVVQFREWAEAKLVHAPCAIDALGIPFMLRRDVTISSACAQCKRPIEIEVVGRSIVSCVPAETVVWVGTAYVGHAATSVCSTIDFFCSAAHASAWWQARPHEVGHVKRLGEALYLGKGIFEDLLTSHPAAPASALAAPSPAASANSTMMATSAAGLLAALLASVCCLGPVVFAALGVSVGATGLLAGTAGVLKTLVPYRALFIGFTAMCLGASFYLAYRKPRAIGAACEGCGSAFGFQRCRWVLWFVAGIAAALVLAPYWLKSVGG
jgi:mercuric ion transport protein